MSILRAQQDLDESIGSLVIDESQDEEDAASASFRYFFCCF